VHLKHGTQHRATESNNGVISTATQQPRAHRLWQTDRTMLVEIWERLRGYDKWIPAEARIAPVTEVRKILGPRARSMPASARRADLLLWKDREGKSHSAGFAAHKSSPLYQLIGGDTVSICYNPADPDRYYCRALSLSWAGVLTKAVLAIIGGVATFVWIFWSVIHDAMQGR